MKRYQPVHFLCAQLERYRVELQGALSEAERFKAAEEQAQHRIQDLHLELEEARNHSAEYVRSMIVICSVYHFFLRNV